MFLAIKKNIHYTTFHIRYLQKHLLLEIGKDHDESCQQSMMGPQVQVRRRPPGASASAAAMDLSRSPGLELCLLLRCSPSSGRRGPMPLRLLD